MTTDKINGTLDGTDRDRVHAPPSFCWAARYRYRFCVPADEETGWNVAESLIAYDMVNNVVVLMSSEYSSSNALASSSLPMLNK